MSEIKKEIAEFKEDLQRFEEEILSYYNEYADLSFIIVSSCSLSIIL